MATNRFHFLALPIAVASIALAACGGGESPEGSGNARADAREAALKFARCMREQGIDMPDPKFGPGGNVGFEISGGNKLAVNGAEEACSKYLEAVRGPELSPQQQRELRENALKFARCMREQGIDMPDPTFEGDGVRMRAGGADGPNPRFQERRANARSTSRRPA